MQNWRLDSAPIVGEIRLTFFWDARRARSIGRRARAMGGVYMREWCVVRCARVRGVVRTRGDGRGGEGATSAHSRD